MNRSNWGIYRVTLTNANTEYSQALTSRPVFIGAYCTSRGGSFRLSLKSDEVEGGDEFRTILPGASWQSPGQIIGDKTIYLSSDTAGLVIEIEEWT